MSRRVRLALAGVLLAVSAVATGGCGSPGDDRVLVVLGPWTDGEEKPFRKALDSIEQQTGKKYVYTGTRSLRETLVAQLQAGAPPDVAVLSSPGELAEYARDGHAHPLPESVAGAAVPPWAPQVTVSGTGDGARTRAYWVPVRVDLKSVVWSRQAGVPQDGEPAWCLAMGSGATSGWPGTDWIEDLMLQRGGTSGYESWATGRTAWSETKEVWQEWGRLLTANGRAPGPRSLTDSFEALGGGAYGLLNRGDCTHEHQGSFIRRHYGDDVRPVPTARFLDGAGRAAEENAFEVSGDLAAVFRPSAAAWDLLGRLTSQDARRSWAEHAAPAERPFFPGGTVDAGQPSAATRDVQSLFDTAGHICLDASDAMPPTLRDAFYRAVLEFVGAPRDAALLGRLLERLDAERRLQLDEGAFVLDDLCDRPVTGTSAG
ncbi:extracellular solute-binding protein [Streptomyces sp. t39]|uniref:extracellular solute-binding protein n=1 Tax=Streptomyces sp. t39 TaxID=1828156 RepID=UPI0011CD3886|nr:extracellular solute-binding protein [Streptomyces sp. t39]TXS55652.1 extracellular solute-binding protein [Streptomyces sp. t39]